MSWVPSSAAAAGAHRCALERLARGAGLSLLVVVAHPDDETVGAGATLGALATLGSTTIEIVHVTDGAPRDVALRPTLCGVSRSDAAAVRAAEVASALRAGGLDADAVVRPWPCVPDQEAALHMPHVARAIAARIAARPASAWPAHREYFAEVVERRLRPPHRWIGPVGFERRGSRRAVAIRRPRARGAAFDERAACARRAHLFGVQWTLAWPECTSSERRAPRDTVRRMRATARRPSHQFRLPTVVSPTRTTQYADGARRRARLVKLRMSSYELRRGRASDARAVRRILSSVLSEHGLKVVDLRADVEIARYADVDPSKDRFVAVFEGKVIGFAIVVPITGGSGASDTSGATGELSHVFVERAHRRHGVGTLLIARAVDAAKARGYVSLHLSTMEAFGAACSYYERHGWIREKEARGSIFFELPLAAPPPVAQEPPPLLPPIPWTLHGVLSLLSRFARVRERLERDLRPKRAESGGGSARSD